MLFRFYGVGFLLSLFLFHHGFKVLVLWHINIDSSVVFYFSNLSNRNDLLDKYVVLVYFYFSNLGIVCVLSLNISSLCNHT